jgi:hypothetical protein
MSSTYCPGGSSGIRLLSEKGHSTDSGVKVIEIVKAVSDAAGKGGE